MRGIDFTVDFRQEAPRETIELRLSDLIGGDFDQRVVPAFRTRADRYPAQ